MGAGAPVSPALLAHDVVDDVVAAACLPGRMPLEDDGGLVHDGDHIPRAGRHTCAHGEGKDIRERPPAADAFRVGFYYD